MDFGASHKKWDGKFCGCQSLLALDCDDKVFSYCEHCQNFHRKRSKIPVVCSRITSSAALNELDVFTSAIDDLKCNSNFQEYTDLSANFV